MFEPMELTNDAVIKVIGVGGGGGNAVAVYRKSYNEQLCNKTCMGRGR